MAITPESAGSSTGDNIYLGLLAAAELLGVTPAELRRRIRRGELASVDLAGQTLVRRLDLERYLAPIQLAGGRTFDRRRLRGG